MNGEWSFSNSTKEVVHTTIFTPEAITYHPTALGFNSTTTLSPSGGLLTERLPFHHEEYCLIRRHDFFERYSTLYFNVYFWFRVLFIHFVPCVVLLVMNGMLIGALRSARLRRRRLMHLQQPKPTQSIQLEQPLESHMESRTMTDPFQLRDHQSTAAIEMNEAKSVDGTSAQKHRQLVKRRDRRASLKNFRQRLRQKTQFSSSSVVLSHQSTVSFESCPPETGQALVDAVFPEVKQGCGVKDNGCAVDRGSFVAVANDKLPEEKWTKKTEDRHIIISGSCPDEKRQDGKSARGGVLFLSNLAPISDETSQTILIQTESESNARKLLSDNMAISNISRSLETQDDASKHLLPLGSVGANRIILCPPRRSTITTNKHSNITNNPTSSRDNRRLSDIDNTTRMLVVVVGLVLLVELPQLCLFVIYVFMQNFHVVLIKDEVLGRLTVTSNLCIVLSYPLNFFIYCAMSRKFKTAIYRMVVCRKR